MSIPREVPGVLASQFQSTTTPSAAYGEDKDTEACLPAVVESPGAQGPAGMFSRDALSNKGFEPRLYQALLLCEERRGSRMSGCEGRAVGEPLEPGWEAPSPLCRMQCEDLHGTVEAVTSALGLVLQLSRVHFCAPRRSRCLIPGG